ncbi:MAG: thymidylate synthase [bacterium]
MAENKHPEYQYLDLLKDIFKNGKDKKIWGNPGVKIRAVFGRQIRFDLGQGFPLLTTKKVFLRGIIQELIWLLKGSSNIKYLVDNDVHIWDEWGYKQYLDLVKKEKVKNKLSMEEYINKVKTNAIFAKKYGELGSVYGVQWRSWPTSTKRTIDQLGWAINKLKDPKQRFRKHIMISAWNPEYIYEMAVSRETSVVLPPCHTIYQFNVIRDKLNLQLYQRSADVFLGVPFNIASYALLLLIVAKIVNLKPGDFVHTFGDIHIYNNHFQQVKEQIKRKPRPFPKIKINSKVKNIDNLKFEDFELIGYNPHPALKGEVTVVGGF